MRTGIANIARVLRFLACIVTVLAIFAVLPVPAIHGVARAEPGGLPAPIAAGDFRPFDERRAALGRLLFYDKILSGNRNISCGTCHNHDFGGSDGLSLGIGEGGTGMGADRTFADGPDRPNARVPRNANALFNLGHRDIRVLFHDGRVSADDSYGTGFNTPAEEWLPEGLQSVLAAQALFPVTSAVEMAGHTGENDISVARNDRIDRVWPIVVARVAAIPEYVRLFGEAFDDVRWQGDIGIVHIANAIDDFINSEWRAVDAPFDRYLAGDNRALGPAQKRGMALFFGAAGCAGCHAGPLFTDQRFHALAIPPFGPGRTRAFDPQVRDPGRMNETDDPADAYRFRTPGLRNVVETGPWGHNGAYATLEGIVRHHLDPRNGVATWDRGQVIMPADARFALTDFAVWEDRREMARFLDRIDIEPVALADGEVADLIAFLHALTDPRASVGRLGKPQSVPSGLSVD